VIYVSDSKLTVVCKIWFSAILLKKRRKNRQAEFP